MSGEEFLNILYKDLALSSNVVKLADNSNDKIVNITKYLDRLEKINKLASTEHKRELLFELYFNKYVIKKNDISDCFSEEEKERIIQSQKNSLKNWLKYLTDKNTRYPMWAKYWVFQGMLKIGNPNEENNSYMKRNKKTLSPFIEMNPAIIAKCVSIMEENFDKTDKKSLSDFVENGNFQKMYCKYLQEFKKEQNQKSGFTGRWVKYHEKSEQDAKKLFESLQGFGCTWCTAGSFEVAKEQIMGGKNYEGGDFYVYYTNNEKNEAIIPRLAIRMDGKNYIAEIRGVADSSQNIEEGLEDIVKRKLDDMPFLSEESRERNYKAVEDTIRLTFLNQKNARKENFFLEEQKFLLELDRKIEGFGWDEDSRIAKLRSKIKIQDIDLAISYLKKNLHKLTLSDNSKITYIIESRIYKTIISDRKILEKISSSVEDILTICSPEISFEILSENTDLGIDDTNIAFRSNLEYVVKFAKLVIDETGHFYGFRCCSESLKKDKNAVIEIVKLDAFAIRDAAPELKVDIDVINAAKNSLIPYKYINDYYEEFLESQKTQKTKKL